eukprot:TRINITY_DN10919_c0_g1_i1.p1 TRINITY_DN10919_c0_g1~~TRINITY_DN10919_c0_g1_i1.p1  ORF type:complete len:347 (-),score=129.12 TRINITY_DN10919_c0_g1_i1:27-1067(-)
MRGSISLLMLLGLVLISLTQISAESLPQASNATGVYTQWTSVLSQIVSYSPYIDFGKSNVTMNAVNYTKLATTPDLLLQFQGFLDQIATTNYSTLNASRTTYYAFYINAFNAIAVNQIITSPCMSDPFGKCSKAIDGVEDIDDFWDTQAKVAGGDLTLRQIHQILRIRNDTNHYPLDPRIHAAVACASISCPDLAMAAYEPDTLDATLNKQMGLFLMHYKKGMDIDRKKIQITLNKIFEWYEVDFQLVAVTLANFISQGDFGLPETDVSYLKAVAETNYLSYKFFDFEWGLNGWVGTLGLCGSRSCFPLWALLLSIFGSIFLVLVVAGAAGAAFVAYRRRNAQEVI